MGAPGGMLRVAATLNSTHQDNLLTDPRVPQGAPGCISQLTCLLGRLKLAQYSFAWVRNEGHMLERAS